MSDPKWLAEDRRFAQKEVPMGVWSSPVSTIAETVRALRRAHAEIDRLAGRVKELHVLVDPQQHSANYTEALMRLLQKIDPEFTDQVTEADEDL